MTVSTTAPASIDDILKTAAKSLARAVAEWDQSERPKEGLYCRVRSAKNLLCDVSDPEDPLLPERSAGLRNRERFHLGSH